MSMLRNVHTIMAYADARLIIRHVQNIANSGNMGSHNDVKIESISKLMSKQ